MYKLYSVHLFFKSLLLSSESLFFAGSLPSSKNKKGLPNCEVSLFTNAADRNRTGTGITTHGILSPGRLPVPPLRHIYNCHCRMGPTGLEPVTLCL